MKKPQRAFIIAEAGVNHNGSLGLAKALVDEAFKAGANAVKFQTFNADRLVTKKAPKAAYQQETDKESQTQWEMIKRLELDETAHRELFSYCKKLGIEFMSTPFDEESVDLLVRLGVRRIKIPSGEITNAPLLLKMARTGMPCILSTGMSTLQEVREALGVIAFGRLNPAGQKPGITAFRKSFSSREGKLVLKKGVTLLHCTTEYPAPFKDVNLLAMDTLRERFGLPVGLSDHSAGFSVAIAAVARGASAVEKHFTLNKSLPGPDHRASLEPGELQAMIRGIRNVEEALGTGRKVSAPSEARNIPVARKSIVAAIDVKKGEVFSTKNITGKRPGTGLSPMHYWEVLGKRVPTNLKSDELVKL